MSFCIWKQDTLSDTCHALSSSPSSSSHGYDTTHARLNGFITVSILASLLHVTGLRSEHNKHLVVCLVACFRTSCQGLFTDSANPAPYAQQPLPIKLACAISFRGIQKYITWMFRISKISGLTVSSIKDIITLPSLEHKKLWRSFAVIIVMSHQWQPINEDQNILVFICLQLWRQWMKVS